MGRKGSIWYGFWKFQKKLEALSSRHLELLVVEALGYHRNCYDEWSSCRREGVVINSKIGPPLEDRKMKTSPSCQDGSIASNYSEDKDLGEEDEEEKRWIEQFRPMGGQCRRYRFFCSCEGRNETDFSLRRSPQIKSNSSWVWVSFLGIQRIPASPSPVNVHVDSHHFVSIRREQDFKFSRVVAYLHGFFLDLLEVDEDQWSWHFRNLRIIHANLAYLSQKSTPPRPVYRPCYSRSPFEANSSFHWSSPIMCNRNCIFKKTQFQRPGTKPAAQTATKLDPFRRGLWDSFTFPYRNHRDPRGHGGALAILCATGARGLVGRGLCGGSKVEPPGADCYKLQFYSVISPL